MSIGVVSLLFGIGVGAWIFSKTSHRTNDNRTSIITSVFVGLIAMFVFYTLFHFTFSK